MMLATRCSPPSLISDKAIKVLMATSLCYKSSSFSTTGRNYKATFEQGFAQSSYMIQE